MEFLITGMTCEGCAKNVQRVIEKVPGVVKADISLTQNHATVSTNTSVDPLAVVQAVKNAGYGAEPA